MFKKIIFIAVLLMMFSNLGWAEGKYSIKSMTPEMQQALDGRKDRFGGLRLLKSIGSVGENNRGYVEVLYIDAKSLAPDVVAEENHDRQIIYRTITQQNDLEGALSTIESAFADVQREKAEAGDKIQTEDGHWITK